METFGCASICLFSSFISESASETSRSPVRRRRPERQQENTAYSTGGQDWIHVQSTLDFFVFSLFRTNGLLTKVRKSVSPEKKRMDPVL
ncbi:hypothetical protein GDO81_029833 [Engystomops pustulosus]|uniref:Secreted protein n=1 Tax=Engystomops pustulosus TaxID=76066 RepID=A0AAV6YDW6_ENGPU|nr:hypothetical protein GDO81_029833 [Engystomops pustulosus]